MMGLGGGVGGRGTDDRELVDACLKGDEKAWGDLIDRYSRLIFSIPLRYGLARDDAADVFQAVCLDLVTGLPQLRDAQALPAWLMQTTVHKVLRWKKRGERFADDDSALMDMTAPAATPDEIIERAEREQALRDAIDDLPVRCRVMVQMLFFETPAVPYRDVAARLGLARGSIGFMRSRCLDRLRAALERIGV
jgi:RNA polymerase sigma factor (sigma-70 family)